MQHELKRRGHLHVLDPTRSARRKWARRRGLVLLIGAVCGVSCAFATGCGGTDALTLGATLSNLLDQVQSTIANAGAVTQGVVISAGGQVYSSIEAARASYDYELGKTVDKLDDVTTKKLQELQSIVNDFQSNLDQTVRDTAQRAQQLVLTLPFANKAPQVSSYSPRFTAASSGSSVVLKLHGVFAFAQQSHYTPHLSVGNRVFDPVSNTTQDLAFQVPAAAFGTPSESGIGLAQATLTVPFKDGILKKENTARYTLLLGSLPSVPGKLVLHTVTHVPSQDRQSLDSRTFSQYSSNDDLDGNYCSDPAPTGWTMDAPTVNFVVTGPDNGHAQGSEGDQWYKQVKRLDGQQVCYFVHTVHHRFGTSGKVDFHIHYDVVRATDTTSNADEPLSVKWGDQVSRSVRTGEWSLVYDAFDGHHQEISAPYRDKFIAVGISGNNVVIRALDPSEIDF